MSFIDSYKRLEKLCSDAYGEKHGISAYIDKMTAIHDGQFTVSGWNADLKMLKHCRWARNRIVHDPGCTEANTCDSGDEEWLIDFYKRMLVGKDPLALYRKAKAPKPKPKRDPQYVYTPTQNANYSRANSSSDGCMTFIMISAVLAIAMGCITLVMVYGGVL